MIVPLPPGSVSGTASPLPGTFNAASYFVDRHSLEGRGSHVAIECGNEAVTYAGVLDRVNRVGSALRSELGVRAEERVALLLADGPEWIYSFFAAIKIGAVAVPISTLWKPAEYEYVLNDSRAGVLIVGEALLPQITAVRRHLRHLRELVVVGSGSPPEGARAFSDLLAFGSAELDPDPTSKDAPAFWLYSSGSTGVPKGCVHLQHDMVVCADAYARGVLGIGAADRCFSVAKLFFAYGLGNALYFPFAAGATTILWPGAPTAANVYAVIEKHRPTLLFSVPTNYATLLACARDSRDFDLSSIRCAVSAGEPLPPPLFERFKARFGIEILDGIGSTEVLHIFISNRPGDVRPGSSGRLVEGYQAKILDEQDRPVAAGELGSLLIKGDSTCAFFWNQHDKTKATIEGEWIRTGDQFYQDAEGYYWYAGRSDDMLKVGGIWVSPVELENVLLEHPAVLECAVAGRLDTDGLVKPAAFIIVRSPAEATPALASELQRFVRSRTAEYKRPRWVCFVRELPKTGTGKIQRFKLRQRVPADAACVELR
jgi:benzoate-CoA ligase family protein